MRFKCAGDGEPFATYQKSGVFWEGVPGMQKSIMNVDGVDVYVVEYDFVDDTTYEEGYSSRNFYMYEDTYNSLNCDNMQGTSKDECICLIKAIIYKQKYGYDCFDCRDGGDENFQTNCGGGSGNYYDDGPTGYSDDGSCCGPGAIILAILGLAFFRKA